MPPYSYELTRIARPCLPTRNRTQEASRDCSGIAAGKGAASGNKIGEGSTIDRDLQHAAIMASFQIVVMPEAEVDPIVVRWNEHGRRIQGRVSHTTRSIMEYRVGSRLRHRVSCYPTAGLGTSAARFAIRRTRAERTYPVYGQGRWRHRIETLAKESEIWRCSGRTRGRGYSGSGYCR